MMYGKYLISAIFLGISMTIFAQEINFDDLQRPGSELSRTATISGLAAEGLRYRDQFIGNDDVRIEEANQARSRYSSSSSSSSSGSSSSSNQSVSKSSQKSKTFICEIYCESASGPRISREFNGANKDEVVRYVGDNADRICNSSGVSKRASGRSFSASQCREK